MSHQQWIANYISPRTPYKGLLVYHETGTGKTCTAVSIAENFRKELSQLNKKIFILCSDNVKDQFYKTIANPDPDSLKCTRNVYNDMLMDENITQKKLNAKINEYYEFMTHFTFGSKVMETVFGKNHG